MKFYRYVKMVLPLSLYSKPRQITYPLQPLKILQSPETMKWSKKTNYYSTSAIITHVMKANCTMPIQTIGKAPAFIKTFQNCLPSYQMLIPFTGFGNGSLFLHSYS